MSPVKLLSLATLLHTSHALEAPTFPAQARIQHPELRSSASFTGIESLCLSPSLDLQDLDIPIRSKYLGLTTFANLPYEESCLDKDSKDPLADIVVIGAPFDTGKLLINVDCGLQIQEYPLTYSIRCLSQTRRSIWSLWNQSRVAA